MEKIKKNIWIIILILALFIIFIPIKIPNNFPTYAKILPEKEFVVIKGSNGQIISHLVNNFTGVVEDVRTIQVDREDFASFSLNISNSSVAMGDTIAVFTSSHTNFIMEEVKGEILEQEQFLEVQLAGEKPSVITEQEKNHEISKLEFLNQQKIFDRKEELYKNELISEEEFEIAKNILNSLKLAEEKEFNKLLSYKTGVKSEEILVTKERISFLKKQDEILENRISDYNIVAPFDGMVFGSSSLDTIFTVAKRNSYVALIPININISNNIQIKQSISFPITDSLKNITIQTKDRQIKSINGEKYIIYRSKFETDKNLFIGIYECSIISEEITLLEILINKFNSIFKFS
jgi:hypothetical protein